jgi:glycosyltransferase involved in cell wall biosynthesis
LRILHITAAYKPAFIYGGPTMSVALLCEQLSEAGAYIEVFTTTANGVDELSMIPNEPVMVDGVMVTYFTRITKDHTHFSPALLKALLGRINEFDIVHIHAWWNLVSVLSCHIAFLKKVPVIISPRGMLSNYTFSNKNVGFKNLIHKVLGRRLLKRSHMHVTSAKESIAVSKLVTSLSITTIPNFVKLDDEKNYAEKLALPYLKLLFFSRIEEKKGLDILLDALKLVSVPYHLTIAGNGNNDYIDRLKTIAINNHIDDKITWAGFFGDNKFELLHQHDLLILPSHDENFGNVVIESLSVGTAVLITEHVGLANYVTDNKLGWVCQTTPQSVSEAINDIGINHIDDLKEITKIAPGIVRADFTGHKLTQEYINLYQKIIGNE